MSLGTPIRPKLAVPAWAVLRRTPKGHRALLARVGLSVLLLRRHPRTAAWLITRRRHRGQLRAGSIGFALGVAGALAAQSFVARRSAAPADPLISELFADEPPGSER